VPLDGQRQRIFGRENTTAAYCGIAEQGLRLRRPPADRIDLRQFQAAGERVTVIDTEDLLRICPGPLGVFQRGRHPSRRVTGGSVQGAGRDGVRVGRAEHPLPVTEQPLSVREALGDATLNQQRRGQVLARGHRIREAGTLDMLAIG
jgi:hypothetical protein